MSTGTHTAHKIATRAVEIAAQQSPPDFSDFDDLGVAIYATDGDGVLTYFNRACIGFAGRKPFLNLDRWCVTWRLHTLDGEFLPHDQCPMAVALQRKTSVRGAVAVAERPDGTRWVFMPFPTPVFDSSGDLLGAVNVLVDAESGGVANFLRDEARRCRRLVPLVDDATAVTLDMLASEYEETARRLAVR